MMTYGNLHHSLEQVGPSRVTNNGDIEILTFGEFVQNGHSWRKLKDSSGEVDSETCKNENYSDPLDLFPFRRFNHYNELGYNLVAKTILKKIKEYEKK